MIYFDEFLLKLKLFKSDGDFVDGITAFVEYYSFEHSGWFGIFTDTIKSGQLRISKIVRTANADESVFFDLIATGKLPPMRVSPKNPIVEGLSKQQIFASSFVFNLEEGAGLPPLFTIDFGTLSLVPNELILDTNTDFTDILPVANYFPVTITTTEPEEPEEPETPPVPIQDLYANLVSEITTAANAADGLPFKLSNISLKLKALVHGDGESLNASLLTLENSEHVNGDAISELVFDITPVSNRENDSIAVPNLLGLTETAVRKILKNLGLKINPVYQKKDAVVNGDSFRQFPAPGTYIQPNQLVTVIFNKHE